MNTTDMYIDAWGPLVQGQFPVGSVVEYRLEGTEECEAETNGGKVVHVFEEYGIVHYLIYSLDGGLADVTADDINEGRR